MSVSALDRPARTVRRRVLSVLSVLITVLGLVLVGGASASAQTADYGPTSDFPYPHNGCSYVPEAPSGISFTTACNHHDGCYYTHAYSQSVCDGIFYSEMRAACAAGTWWRRPACEGFAAIYYLGVRIFGAFYYGSPSPTVRISTPMA